MKRIILNKKGFTLVELLVVLVIIGILAGMTVPAFTGYIRKQKEKEAIQECKQVVASTQNMYMDKAAKNQIISLGLSSAECVSATELAGVNGTIQGTPVFDGTATASNPEPAYRITLLSYKSANGIGVKYDVTKNPCYFLEDTSTYAELDAFVKTYQDMVKEFYETGKYTDRQLQGSREVITKYILEELQKTNPDYRLPSVDPALLSSPIFGSLKDPLYWQPYYINDKDPSNPTKPGGSHNSTITVLFATKADGSNTDPTVLRQGWKAYLVYVNGVIYETTKTNWNATLVEGSSISNLTSATDLESIDAILKAAGFKVKE